MTGYQGIKALFQGLFTMLGFFLVCSSFSVCEMFPSENAEEHYQFHYLKKKLSWHQLSPLCYFFVVVAETKPVIAEFIF